MKTIILRLAILGIGAVSCFRVAAAADHVIVPEHVRIALESRILNESRVINVFVPKQVSENPRARVPALYMLDGGVEEDFIHVARTVEDGIRHGEMAPVILVGIQNTERRRDMTGPTAVPSDREIAPRVGGSIAFRKFIRDELMPEIEASFPVNTRKGIIGESLAGLFIMETLAVELNLFDTYIALSPSLWWNDAALVGKLRAAKGPTKGIRVYLASANEDNIAPHVETLRRSLGDAHQGWLIEARPDLDHSTIYRILGPRAIRLLFPKVQP